MYSLSYLFQFSDRLSYFVLYYPGSKFQQEKKVDRQTASTGVCQTALNALFSPMFFFFFSTENRATLCLAIL